MSKLGTGYLAMIIKVKIGTPNKDRETCIQEKSTESRNKRPNRRATSVFELVYIDLTGTIEPVDINGHRYAITITDDFSGLVFVYCLKSKDNTVSTI